MSALVSPLVESPVSAAQPAADDWVSGEAHETPADKREKKSGAWRGMAACALLDQAVVSGANFGISILVKRTCDDAGLGLYSLAFSLLILVINIHGAVVISPFTFLSHQFSERRQRLFAGSTLVLHAMATLLGVAVAVPIALLVAARGGETVALAWAVAICVPCWMLREYSRRMALAKLRMGLTLLLDVAITLVGAGLLTWLAWSGHISAATAHLAMGAAMLAVSLAWLSLDRRQFTIERSALRADLPRCWSFGKWVCADQIITVANVYAAHWVLQILLGEVATGRLAACLLVARLANPALFALGNVLEPRAGQALARGGMRGLRQLVATIAWWVGLGMALVALAFALLGPLLVRLVFATDFPGMSWAIAFLALQVLTVALSIVYQTGLRAAERSGTNLTIGVTCLAITVVAAVAAVPLWGVVGAAFALALGNLSIWLARWFMFQAVTAEHAPEVLA